jgi:hypothetical protein
MAVQAIVVEELQDQVTVQVVKDASNDKIKQTQSAEVLSQLRSQTLERIAQMGYQVTPIGTEEAPAWQLSNAYQQVEIHSLEGLIQFANSVTQGFVELKSGNNHVLELGIMVTLLLTCAACSYLMTTAQFTL